MGKFHFDFCFALKLLIRRGVYLIMKYVFALSVSVLFFCRLAAEDKPNLVFLMSDQWRAQAVGIAGEDIVWTPTFDRLARGGVWFRQAVCNSPICGPNRATIFTGTYVPTHGEDHNDKRLPADRHTIFKSLKAAGYEVAYIGKWHMGGKYSAEEGAPKDNIAGIDYFLDSIGGHKHFKRLYKLNDEPAKDYGEGWQPEFEVQRGIEWVGQNKGKPFALFISFGPPHTGGGVGYEGRRKPYDFITSKPPHGGGYGYAAPREFESMYKPEINFLVRPNVKFKLDERNREPVESAVAGYFGAITSIDVNTGKLIDYLAKEGLLEKTMVVITSDHGEMLGSQGRMTKGIWFEEAVRVPALFYQKGRIQPLASDAIFSSVDLTPSILGMLGVEIPKSVEGTNFAPLIEGKGPVSVEEAFIHFYGAPEAPRDFKGLRNSRYTYAIAQYVDWYKRFNPPIDSPYGILYDNKTDPYQMKPIYYGQSPETDAVMKDLHSKLAAHLKAVKDPFIEKRWKAEMKVVPRAERRGKDRVAPLLSDDD